MAYRPIIQFGIVALACLSGIIATFGFAHAALGWHLVWSDFTVFWTAARFDDPYNAKALTEAQQWILPPGSGLRPFPYPPTALIFLRPLAWVGYFPAAIVWAVFGLIAFASASLLYGRNAVLGLLSPMVGATLVTGQASLFFGGAIAASIALLGKRDNFAGILLGVVATVKPQLAILFPIAIIAGRHWRAIPPAVAGCGIVVLASLAFGPRLWVDWLASLPQFSDQVLTQGNVANMAPGLIFAPVGVISVAATFYLSARPEIRLVALVSGSCLCLPYMMNYDLAAMSPAAAVLLLGKDWRGWIVGLLAFAVMRFSPIIVSVLVPVLCLGDGFETANVHFNRFTRHGAVRR